MTETEPNDESWRSMKMLHVYGQLAWHDEVVIVGEREALEGLRDTINLALDQYGKIPPTGAMTDFVMVNDGEGYKVGVIVATPELMETLAVPYTDEVAAENQEKRVWPHELLFERRK